MDQELMHAIKNDNLRAYQTLIPNSVAPRLDIDRLPVIQITQRHFIDSLIWPRSLEVLHATNKKAAKILMTRMRDAQISGPCLRKAHKQTGSYLATEYLSEVIGVQEYSIQHVQGHKTDGYRLFYEHETIIVALMRGGEPMAFGVNDIFPTAMFLHANKPEDIKEDHIKQAMNLVLVDSVVNTGKTISQFIRHIRNLNSTVRIAIVTGVVQAEAIDILNHELAPYGSYEKISMIALRLSNNKYQGIGTTDTGNRLFNTIHLQ